jgi:hypothetical protein
MEISQAMTSDRIGGACKGEVMRLRSGMGRAVTWDQTSDLHDRAGEA